MKLDVHPEDLQVGQKYRIIQRISAGGRRVVCGDFVKLANNKLELYVRLEIANGFMEVMWKSIEKITCVS